jgi:hypothetical protein
MNQNINFSINNLEEISDKNTKLEAGLILVKRDPDGIMNYRLLQENEFEPASLVQHAVNEGFTVMKSLS